MLHIPIALSPVRLAAGQVWQARFFPDYWYTPELDASGQPVQLRICAVDGVTGDVRYYTSRTGIPTDVPAWRMALLLFPMWRLVEDPESWRLPIYTGRPVLRSRDVQDLPE